MTDLTDFGFEADPQLREVARNRWGNVVCPLNDCHLDDRGPIGLPGSVVLREDVTDDARLESLGWTCDDHSVQIPVTVTGPDANGLTPAWVGVPAEFADGTHYWVPVKETDLEGTPQTDSRPRSERV